MAIIQNERGKFLFQIIVRNRCVLACEKRLSYRPQTASLFRTWARIVASSNLDVNDTKKLTIHHTIQAFYRSFTGPGQELSELRYQSGPCYAYARLTLGYLMLRLCAKLKLSIHLVTFLNFTLITRVLLRQTSWTVEDIHGKR